MSARRLPDLHIDHRRHAKAANKHARILFLPPLSPSPTLLCRSGVLAFVLDEYDVDLNKHDHTKNIVTFNINIVRICCDITFSKYETKQHHSQRKHCASNALSPLPSLSPPPVLRNSPPTNPPLGRPGSTTCVADSTPAHKTSLAKVRKNMALFKALFLALYPNCSSNKKTKQQTRDERIHQLPVVIATMDVRASIHIMKPADYRSLLVYEAGGGGGGDAWVTPRQSVKHNKKSTGLLDCRR